LEQEVGIGEIDEAEKLLAAPLYREPKPILNSVFVEDL
jgi:hypothetical protein